MRLLTKCLTTIFVLQTVVNAPLSAQTSCNLSFPPPNNSFAISKNLTYEVAPDGEVEQLDLLVPTQVSNPPLLVQIHGGGFIAGDKSSFISQAAILAENGFAVANLNYRLSTATTNQFPAAVRDVRCAVQWLRSQASIYGYSAGKIGALGYSAGGNLASMLGVAGGTNGVLDSPSCSALQYSPAVQAVASYYGLYDWTITTALAPYLGGLPSTSPLAVPASPISYLNATSPPFILIRGADDQNIPLVQQTEMAAALQNAAVPVQTYNINGLGHGFNPFSTVLAPAAQPSTCAMLAFFASNLN